MEAVLDVSSEKREKGLFYVIFFTIAYIGLSYEEAKHACLIFDFTLTKFYNLFSWIQL